MNPDPEETQDHRGVQRKTLTTTSSCSIRIDKRKTPTFTSPCSDCINNRETLTSTSPCSICINNRRTLTSTGPCIFCNNNNNQGPFPALQTCAGFRTWPSSVVS